MDSLTGGDIAGRRSGGYSGILIPCFRAGSDHVREYRLRRDHPDLEYDSAGNLKRRQKHLSPLRIVVTEGGFKTLALWLLANHGFFPSESPLISIPIPARPAITLPDTAAAVAIVIGSIVRRRTSGFGYEQEADPRAGHEQSGHEWLRVIYEWRMVSDADSRVEYSLEHVNALQERSTGNE